MPEVFQGKVDVLNGDGELIFQIDPDRAAVWVYRREDGRDRPYLQYQRDEGSLSVGNIGGGSGAGGKLVLRSDTGSSGVILLGSGGLVINRPGLEDNALMFSASTAMLTLGSDGHPGDLRVFDGYGGGVRIDGDGTVSIRDDSGPTPRVLLNFNPRGRHLSVDGHLTVGGEAADGSIDVEDDHGNRTVRIDGSTGVISTVGDIRLTGGDCAEEFATEAMLEPGTVVVVDEAGTIAPCQRPYDTRVVGVVSGGSRYPTGISLGHGGSSESTHSPIALTGRVSCLVDAGTESVEPGDPLTTSSRHGYAMKAADRERAHGATLGKALAASSERGPLPVLLALH